MRQDISESSGQWARMDDTPLQVARELRRIGVDKQRLGALAAQGITADALLRWLRWLPSDLGHDAFMERLERWADDGGLKAAVAHEALPAGDPLMLEVRYVFEPTLRGDRGPRLLRYLLARGADEFAITVMALEDTPAPFADRFEDELAPHERPVGERRVILDSTSSGLTSPVRLWSFNAASVERLLSFLDKGLFHCPAGPDGWLEDLTVYRRGQLVLGLFSHEQTGALRLTPAEHAEVAALDIPSKPTAEWIRY